MSSPTRRTILETHQLSLAPTVLQREFWRRYNFSNKINRRRPVLVGDLVPRFVPEVAVGPGAPQLQGLQDAWHRVVAPRYRTCTRVEMLTNGRLIIRVDCSTTRFMLSREMGSQAVTVLNEFLGAARVKKIDFRIGPVNDGLQPPLHLPETGAPPRPDFAS